MSNMKKTSGVYAGNVRQVRTEYRRAMTNIDCFFSTQVSVSRVYVVIDSFYMPTSYAS